MLLNHGVRKGLRKAKERQFHKSYENKYAQLNYS